MVVVKNVLYIFSSTDDFVIPELPCGQRLVIKILSTWGDQYYVGLNGIEIFSDTGKPVQISKVRVPSKLTPHYLTSHHTTPHYLTSHHITLHHTTLHYTQPHHIVPLHSTSLLITTLNHTTLHHSTPPHHTESDHTSPHSVCSIILTNLKECFYLGLFFNYILH